MQRAWSKDIAMATWNVCTMLKPGKMQEVAQEKIMLKGRLYSKRRKVGPRMRWLDDVESDLKKMKVKGWKEEMRNREQWRLVVEEARAVEPSGRTIYQVHGITFQKRVIIKTKIRSPARNRTPATLPEGSSLLTAPSRYTAYMVFKHNFR
jgi:hypothetical protein